ncbi:MAG: cupin domain-containing protein, partial [Tannerella sp.]|nr:cupin domain-containing protein [Tannerella sp.]
DYTIDDCCYFLGKNADWQNEKKETVVRFLDKNFADGFQILMNRVTTNDRIFQNENPSRLGQAAIYIIEGEADVTLNGQQAGIEADNTFYSPKGSVYSLKKRGDKPLIFLTITTE